MVVVPGLGEVVERDAHAAQHNAIGFDAGRRRLGKERQAMSTASKFPTMPISWSIPSAAAYRSRRTDAREISGLRYDRKARCTPFPREPLWAKIQVSWERQTTMGRGHRQISTRGEGMGSCRPVGLNTE